MEEWTHIEEFPMYSISNHGRLRRNDTGQILKPGVTERGHLYAAFTINRTAYRRSLPKLVADAFVPNPSPRTFDTPIHLNANRRDCSSQNLMWRPRWFAVRYSLQFALGLSTPPPIADMQTDEVYENIWTLITERGLLYNEIIHGINHNMYVFPTMEFFRWAYPQV